MKPPLVILAGVFLWMQSPAAIRYVNVNNAAPTPPYTNWATAANVIQDAVDIAEAGDEIVVTNGLYATGGRAVVGTMTNRVAVDKPITVRSVNGPQFTVIRGHKLPGTIIGDGAIRCVYLTNGAGLIGFTLTNGATHSIYNLAGINQPEAAGGGVWCESQEAAISNCVLVSNSARLHGGGAYRGTLIDCTISGNQAIDPFLAQGGGVAWAALANCMLIGNSSTLNGGGAAVSALTNCVVAGNSADEDGGGAAGGTLLNCTIRSNSAFFGGGVIYGTLNNCTLTGNSAQEGGGAYLSTLINCILTVNRAVRLAGGNSRVAGGGAANSTLLNCTITINSSDGVGGGTYAGGLTNSIVYFNSATNGPNHFADHGESLSYCCTTPQPTNGISNITNAPLFVNQAAGDFRLQPTSPCVNVGNNATISAATDLDGNPRIVGGTVDIGAYEFQILQFRLLDSVPNGAGILVRWQSVTGRTYLLERASSLTTLPAFSIIATNIPGQAQTTSYVDTTAIGNGPFFYRVGVEP